jgi:hypothetical protein
MNWPASVDRYSRCALRGSIATAVTLRAAAPKAFVERGPGRSAVGRAEHGRCLLHRVGRRRHGGIDRDRRDRAVPSPLLAGCHVAPASTLLRIA